MGEVQNDAVKLPMGIHLPDGTVVRLELELASNGWPVGYFESTAGALAGEPFERPDQGEFETREEW